MYKLPRELTDYIIDFLYDDFEALRQASLVSRAWLECSRYHLFETLSTRHPKLMELGQTDLATPCKYVRKLILVWISDPAEASLMLGNFRESNIRTLVIVSRRAYQIDQSSIRQGFSTFPCAGITSLEFLCLFCQTQIFLTVTSLLPNIDNLTIAVYQWNQWNEGEPSELNEEFMNKTIFPSFRGRFQHTNPGGRQSLDYGSTVLYLLARMPIRFHTVSLYVNKHNLSIVSSFLDACAPTVQRITLNAAHFETPPHDGLLSPCVNLEELYLGDGFIEIPDAFICYILDSISSRTLSHLTIELSDPCQTGGATWEALDEALVRLQKRQEIGGRLTVELSTPLPAEEMGGRLSRFRDQGLLFIGCRDRRSRR